MDSTCSGFLGVSNSLSHCLIQFTMWWLTHSLITYVTIDITPVIWWCNQTVDQSICEPFYAWTLCLLWWIHDSWFTWRGPFCAPRRTPSQQHSVSRWAYLVCTAPPPVLASTGNKPADREEKIDEVKKRSRMTERISDRTEQEKTRKQRQKRKNQIGSWRKTKIHDMLVLWPDVRVRPWCLLKVKTASLRFMAHAVFPVSCGNRPTVTRLGKNTINLPPKWGNLDSTELIQNSGWNDLLVVLDLTFDVFLSCFCTFVSPLLLFPKMVKEKELCSLSQKDKVFFSGTSY